METSPRHPKFVRWALMLGIVIILNIFFTVLVSLVLPAPQYDNYCTAAITSAAPPSTAAACDATGGMWTDTGTPQPAVAPNGAPVSSGYCDLSYACGNAYAAASDQHDLYAFVFLVVLGILALLAGFMPIGSSMVSSGLSYGGVVALIIGSAEYWGSAGEWIRLLIAAIGLLALLYIGWQRFRD